MVVLRAPPENGRLWKDLLGNRVDLVELPEAGHLLHYEKPEEVVNHIITYLSNLQ